MERKLYAVSVDTEQSTTYVVEADSEDQAIDIATGERDAAGIHCTLYGATRELGAEAREATDEEESLARLDAERQEADAIFDREALKRGREAMSDEFDRAFNVFEHTGNAAFDNSLADVCWPKTHHGEVAFRLARKAVSNGSILMEAMPGGEWHVDVDRDRVRLFAPNTAADGSDDDLAFEIPIDVEGDEPGRVVMAVARAAAVANMLNGMMRERLGKVRSAN